MAVREDLADYYAEIQRFDTEVGQLLRRLEAIGELDNTLIVITGDNGLPFPRAKGHLYDAGVRVPLAIRWGNRAAPARQVSDFTSAADFAPAFLQAAGLPVPPLVERSIDDDEELHQRYAFTIPVVAIGGRELELATSPVRVSCSSLTVP